MSKARSRTTTTRTLAALLSVVTPSPLFAIQPTREPPRDSVPEYASGCLRGSPLPDCTSFWIVEMQRSTALVRPSWTEPGFGDDGPEVEAGSALFEWTLGYMSNRSDRWALGGSVSLGFGAAPGVTGVRARARRWLNPSLSLSVETGVARSSAQRGAYGAGTGPSVGLRLDTDDNVAIFARYDRVEAIPLGHPGSMPPAGHHEYLRVGAGIGGKAALIGTGVMLAVMTVVGAIFFHGAT